MTSNKIQGELFENQRTYRPLADRLRPQLWDDFQQLAELAPELREKLQQANFIPPSMILWGPPGSGKTSFARLIGNHSELDFAEFSAVMSGVKDIKNLVARAKISNKPTLLFVDEIHRFNRSQQDAFLPHIESGLIVLVGATTENPSFYLNAALLSRCRLVHFKTINKHSLEAILTKAEAELKISLSAQVRNFLVKLAAGDARKLLNLVERLYAAGELLTADIDRLTELTSEDQSLFYDRSGDQHYQQISAFIKSLRGSAVDAAMFWGLRIIAAGEDPRFLIRRLIIFASEDIGNADPRALTLACSTLSAFELVGLPEGKIPIAQCITYLATAPKSNASYVAMHEADAMLKQYPHVQVPKHLCNAPTALMRDLGYGQNYHYPHDYVNAHVANETYFPDGIEPVRFYRPSQRGYEKNICERLQLWQASKNKF